ncbi:MAG: hypothetical protein EBZ58_10630 [Bacteroidetes bacterium]|nr:hypothetical protein [Bacteroidota bacterium]
MIRCLLEFKATKFEMKIYFYIAIIFSSIFFMSCEEKAKSVTPNVFNNLFYEDKFDAVSLSSDWTLVKYPADKIEIVNQSLMTFNEPTSDDYPVAFLNKLDYDKNKFQVSFDFKSDYDSVGHSFNILGLTSLTKEVKTQNVTFALFGHKIGIAVGNENNEITLDKVPKGGAWYTMKIENINKTITLIVSLKDGIELGRVDLKYNGNIDGYWGISGAFLENKLTSRSMVYFDNFKIMQ